MILSLSPRRRTPDLAAQAELHSRQQFGNSFSRIAAVERVGAAGGPLIINLETIGRD